MNEREFDSQLSSLITTISAVLNMKEDFMSLTAAEDQKTFDKVKFMLCLSLDETLREKKHKVKELLKQYNF